MKSVFAGLLAACLSAQNAPQSDVVIKVTTRLVQVSVVVHDKHGQAVPNLTKEDFTITDQGLPQSISFFAMETHHPPENPELPPGYYSNRILGDPEHRAVQPNSLHAILLDGLNTTSTDQASWKKGVVKFLLQLRPEDKVAIYSLTEKLTVLHDFTSDTAALLRALEKYKGVTGVPNDAMAREGVDPVSTMGGDAGAAAFAKFLSDGDAATKGMDIRRRVPLTLRALREIAHQMAGLPGRKNLVWITAGIPVALEGPAQLSFLRDIQRSMGDVSGLGLAIYPVNARGILGGSALVPTLAAESTINLRGAGGMIRETPKNMAAPNDDDRNRIGMRTIAALTGGRSFENTNDVGKALRETIEDSSITYVLGFAPTHDHWDGTFREIKIQLKNKDMDARYRKGYFAVPRGAVSGPAREQELSQALAETVNGPLLATGIGVVARIVEWSAGSPLTVRVSIDAHDVSFVRDDSGKWVADLDLLLAVRNADDEVTTRTGRPLHMSLSDAQLEGGKKSGLGLNMQIDAPPESITVRAVARDSATGNLGSVDIPLKKK